MIQSKRLVLFVEKDGDEHAVPILIKKIISQMNGWEYIKLDTRPFLTGGLTGLVPKQA